MFGKGPRRGPPHHFRHGPPPEPPGP
jgi:hypothetical protein